MDNGDDRQKWNARYAARVPEEAPPQAARVLREFQHLLPPTGVALDLACGDGGNALLLAGKHLHTHAWDISDIAIERLNQRANALGLTVYTEVCNVLQHPLEANHYDVIVVSRFLERHLISAIVNALNPGGLVFYQTYIREKSDDCGPSNPLYLLAGNELLQLFSQLHILVYREEGSVGDVTQGFRNEAMLVAQKRARCR